MWEVDHRRPGGLAKLVAGLHQDAILIRQSLGEFFKNTIQELMDRTPATHDAEEYDPARLDGGQQLIEPFSGAFKDVAQWAAECGYHIEGPLFEARQIGDVEYVAPFDRILAPGGSNAIAVQVKLSRRDVADKNPSPEPGQLDGEAPGTGANLEHPVTSVNPTGLKACMKLEANATCDVPVEAIPFGRAVLIVEDPHPVRRVTAGHGVTAE